MITSNSAPVSIGSAGVIWRSWKPSLAEVAGGPLTWADVAVERQVDVERLESGWVARAVILVRAA